MTAVWMASKAQRRRRRAATLALILLVGLAGGVVLAAANGASRTDSAMRRFVAYSRPEDVYVSVNGPGGDPSLPSTLAATLADRARLLTLPQVAEAGRSPYLFLSPDRAGAEIGSINPFCAADGVAFRTVSRPVVLGGRLARLDRPDEVTVDDLTARLRHLRVGSPVTMWSFSAEQSGALFGSGGFGKIPAPEGPAYTFRVVGIVRYPSTVNGPPPSVVEDALYQGQGAMVLTPAFLRRYARDQQMPVEALPGMDGFRVRLRHGPADLPAFRRAVAALARPEDVHAGSDNQHAADKAQRAIHVEAIALGVFAAVGAAAALVIVGQALAREVAADAADNPTLIALGLGRRQLVLVPLIRAALVAVGGGVLAVAVGVALSPLTPIGLARRAEVHPGLSVNVAGLGYGSLAVAGLTLVWALGSSWRAAATRRAPGPAPARPGFLTAGVVRSGLGPAAVTGVAMSFERGGRGNAFRTSLLAALLAVTGVVAAMTFGRSLHHLVHTPSEQGWNWDVVVGNPNTQPSDDPATDPLHAQMVGRLRANRYVAAFAGVGVADGITVDGQAVNLIAIETVKGLVFPPIIEGRTPDSPGEIVLGRDPLRRLHRHVGQTVTLRAGDRPVTMRIVGVWLQPTAGDLSARLSEGGAVTIGGVRRLLPSTPVLQFVVRYRPDVDPAVATRSLLDDFGREVLKPFPGGEVGDLAKVAFLPDMLALLLVVLAVGALGLTLLASVRRHRRDLAVLKTIGFVRRQVSATVAWQATTLAVGALAVGIPCGIGVGHWTWRLVASGLGSVSPPILPPAVLLVIPAALAAANLLAGPPGWAAGRVRPARALRAE